MEITELNDDVLFTVIDYLADDDAALLALVASCSRLAKLAIGRLSILDLEHKSMNCSIRSPLSSGVAQALRDRPAFRSRIEDVTIRNIVVNEGTQKDADVILQELPNIAVLRLERDWRNRPLGPEHRERLISGMDAIRRKLCPDYSRSPEFQHQACVLKGSQRSHIQHLDLKGDFTPSELIDILQLPNIQNLRAEGLKFLGAEVAPGQSSPSSSTVQSIRLYGGWFWHLSYAALAVVLATPKHLLELETWLPARARVSLKVNPRWRMPVEEAFSASSLQASLFPTRHSLTKLILIEDSTVIWPGREDSQLNLSDFVCLAHVTLPSICYFPDGPPTPSRALPAHLLPPNLEDLKIIFNCDSGAFHSRPEALSLNHVTIHEPSQIRTSWIHNLLVQCEADRKSLRIIVTDEELNRPERSWRVYDRLTTVKWTPQPHIAREFNRYGVDLQFNLRVPE